MHWASGIPARPLVEGGRFLAKLGRKPRRGMAEPRLGRRRQIAGEDGYKSAPARMNH
jgi:hypothetical protein